MPELLTKQQYADLLKVSAKTVDEWRAKGLLVEGRDYFRLPSGYPRYYWPKAVRE